MKTITIGALIIAWSSLFSATAKAEQIYLPMILLQAQLESAQENADFQIDQIRLWNAVENGERLEPCGQQHKVQIHVFDVHGDSGPLSRLNGIIVQVTQPGNEPQIEEFRATGLLGSERGMVEFELKQFAEVRIFADVDGRRVSSQMARISTLPQAIPSHYLVAAGYCQDEASCPTAHKPIECTGHFSWNVVFKRRY